MTKITLPPCESFDGKGGCFWAAIGKPCWFVNNQPACWEYVPACGDYPTGFDAVAAAVRKAGYLPLIRGAKYSDDYIAAVISVGGGPLKIELVESEETGPTPTAALVAAAVKVNE